MPVADVWVIDVETLASCGVLDAYRDTLAADEQAQLARFRFDADRRAYLAAHGLVRAALSYRAPGVGAAAWRFLTTAHGRPEVDSPADGRGLRFNLSHTRRTAACVVTEAAADCGVDVEQSDATTDVDLLARGVLTATERASLDGLDPDRRRTAFFRYWTLKEAYVKARGLGMSLPFGSCGFTLGSAPALVDAPGDDAPASWQFTQWHHGQATVVALAVRPACDVVRHDAPP